MREIQCLEWGALPAILHFLGIYTYENVIVNYSHDFVILTFSASIESLRCLQKMIKIRKSFFFVKKMHKRVLKLFTELSVSNHTGRERERGGKVSLSWTIVLGKTFSWEVFSRVQNNRTPLVIDNIGIKISGRKSMRYKMELFFNFRFRNFVIPTL